MRVNDIQETQHGVFMEVAGTGVLIKGEPGIGKSEVALELISRGHKLIADDAVNFSQTETTAITGSCPGLLQNLLEVRGLGILNIKSLYGNSSIKTHMSLSLIIQLVAVNDITENESCESRLHGIHSETKVLGIAFPQTALPVAPGRNLAIMIEVIVRNNFLKTKGYDAYNDLHKRLSKKLNKEQK